jgi:hypothetical protein
VPKWLLMDNDEARTVLAVVEASPLTRTVFVHVQISTGVTLTPELADRFRNMLGLGVGIARGEVGVVGDE